MLRCVTIATLGLSNRLPAMRRSGVNRFCGIVKSVRTSIVGFCAAMACLATATSGVPSGIFILHSFGSFANGANPQAPLVRGTDAFYGTTYSGGPNADDGTVFKVT